ncbi:fasciclin domain-containing protein [Rhodoferax sp.]|uniref:fasciclin domain-containing protein n=1 Tax=Rhodoferax sp. TaxID=50421 RepID=UPI00374D9C1C
MLNRRILSLVFVAATLAGCATTPHPASVAETLAQNPSLSTMNGLITQVGLTATLQGAGPFTVFAPSNEAFKLVPTNTMNDLAKHPEKLKDVLAFHVIAGKLAASDVKNRSVKALNGGEVALSKAGDFVTIESAMVEQSDIQANNGVIHIIDSVLFPPPKK